MDVGRPYSQRLVRLILIGLVTGAGPVQGFAQRYSENAVAYFDSYLVAGSNLVANPFDSGNNTISNLFRGVPSGSFFLHWTGGAVGFYPTNHFSSETGWTDGTRTLVRPQGGFLWLPVATRITFVGEPWPLLCLFGFPPGPAVLAMIPSSEPGPGFCPSWPPPENLQIRKWNRQEQRFNDDEHYIYQSVIGWVPEPPTLALDEAAFIFNPESRAWTVGAAGFKGPPAGAIGQRRAARRRFHFSIPGQWRSHIFGAVHFQSHIRCVAHDSHRDSNTHRWCDYGDCSDRSRRRRILSPALVATVEPIPHRRPISVPILR